MVKEQQMKGFFNLLVFIIIPSNRITIRTDKNGDPTEIYLPATKARSKLAYELFG